MAILLVLTVIAICGLPAVYIKCADTDEKISLFWLCTMFVVTFFSLVFIASYLASVI